MSASVAQVTCMAVAETRCAGGDECARARSDVQVDAHSAWRGFRLALRRKGLRDRFRFWPLWFRTDDRNARCG
eukprot:1749788-Pleurochrysis_carterae.AAC.1